MQILTYIIVLILAIASLAMVIALPRAIGRSVNHGRRFREALDARLGQLRLSKMLGAMGVDRADYLATSRQVDIEQPMKNCRACEQKSLCDAELSSHSANSGFDYCPNRDAIAVTLK